MKTQHRWLIRRTSCDVPVILLAVMIAVSLLVSPLPKRSLRAVWPLLLGIVLYWVIARWPWTERTLAWAWWGIIVAGVVLALVGFVGMEVKSGVLFPWMQRLRLDLQSRMGGFRQRLPDTFHPNVVAGTLALLVPFGAARALVSQHPKAWERWVPSLLASMLTLAMVACVILSQARGAYLGLAMSALVLTALTAPRLLLGLIPLLVALLVAGGSLMGWPNLLKELVSVDPARGLGWREEVWSAAIYLVKDFPFTGVGFGCFEPVVASWYPLAPLGGATHAHNLALQVAVDLGIPGLVAFLTLLGLTFHRLIMAYVACRRAAQWPRAALSAACLASLAGMCVHGVIDAATWGNKGAFVFWVVVGVSLATSRLSCRLSNATQGPQHL